MNTATRPKASNYDVLSFDCYGTLVDWERAITSTLQTILLSHDAHWNDNVLLNCFAQWEPVEQDTGGIYRQVLNRVLKRFATRLGFVATQSQFAQFEECIAQAEPFSDTVNALRALQSTFQLAIISNTDEDLFALTASNLEIPFDFVITAEAVGKYKPDPLVFRQALEQFTCSKSRVLHVAQSLFHDVAPANNLGIATVWIDRSAGKSGATRASNTTPDWTYPSLAEFASAVHGS